MSKVDKILRKFQKTVVELNQHGDVQSAVADQTRIRAGKLMEYAIDADRESTRAHSVASSIEELINSA